MEIRQVLAANMKRLRRAVGLSQEELALRAGLDRTYISSLERCQYAASVDVLAKLAQELGVTPAELLGPNVVGARIAGEADSPF